MPATSCSPPTGAPGWGGRWWSTRCARRGASGSTPCIFNLVFESNPARAMYERLGFEEVGRIPDAIDGEDARDLLAQPGGHRVVSDGSDVTVEQHGEHVGVVCLHRPPNNYFDTAADRRRWPPPTRSWTARAGAVRSCSPRRAGTSAPGSTSPPTRARTSLRSTAPRCGSSPPRSPSSPRCRAPRSAAAAGWRCRPTSGWPRRAAASARTSPASGFHHGFALTVTLPAVVGPPGRGRPACSRGGASAGRRRWRSVCATAWPTRVTCWAQALAYADELARAGPLAVRAIRATLRRGLVDEARLAMEHECAEQLAPAGHGRLRRGVRAAAERRDPRFSGT